MASQLSSDRLLAVLRGEGLQVREYAGWVLSAVLMATIGRRQ